MAERLITVSQTGEAGRHSRGEGPPRGPRVRDRVQTQPPARSRVLHLANLRQAAMQLTLWS